MASRDEVSDLEARVRAAVRESLDCETRSLQWLEAGIGLRRFARVHCDGDGFDTLIARVETAEDPAGRPAGIPPEPPLEPIRSWLEANGLPVPRRYGADRQGAIELLEDLGDVALCDLARVAAARERRALYVDACSLIARLQRVPPRAGVAAFERHLDAALFRYKGGLFAEYSLPDASAGARDCVRAAFEHIGELAAEAPQRLAHRDYQSQNLRICSGRLVMIDLQGAFLAPPEYDLVCLLRDSYVELQAEEIDDLCAEVWPSLPDAPSPELAQLRFDALTLTRKGKDHARFLYAARQRHDLRFLDYVPTTVRHLRHAAARIAGVDPALRDFADLVHTLQEAPCVP